MSNKPVTFPASYAQQRLWFLDQLDPGQSIYNLVYVVRFTEAVDLTLLNRSLYEIVARHESLRTTFESIAGLPVQVINPHTNVTVPVVDLSHLPAADREIAGQRRIAQEAESPFDLAAGPLWSSLLLRLGERESLLTVVMHHIISDGWSMGIFLDEFAVLYDAFAVDAHSPLAELPIQYADYASWQREWLQGEVLEGQLSFWRTHLAGAPPSLELAADRVRPTRQTFKGARVYAELPPSLVGRLRSLSNSAGATLFMTLLAAYYVLLWRYSGQDDLVVGSPIAGRNRAELEGVIGYFANTLPLRVRCADNPSFRELLGRVRETALEAYAHQDLPFDRLVEELRPERSLSHTPLFQVIFAFENAPRGMRVSGSELIPLEIARDTARCDLSLFATDKGDELACMWEYSTDLFDRETIQQMISSYQTLLESILADREASIGDLEIWSAEQLKMDQATIDSGSGQTTSEPTCIHHLFEAQVERIPDQVAVQSGERSLTYQELNDQANQLAHYLQTLGVGPEVLVGVCLERSTELVVALLGVLQAGGAYLPVDPSYPAERLAFMLEDANVALLLTQASLLETLPKLATKVVCIDNPDIRIGENANPLRSGSPENLAYVIYTSGSTGRPKGVQIKHETVVHLFAATRDKIGFRDGDIWTVVHSSAFDFSVWEIWGSLLQGGTLVVVPLAVVQSPTEFYELLCREQVTILNQTPAALRELLRARAHALSGWLAVDYPERVALGQAGESPAALTAHHDWSVRIIVCGGDALDLELATQLSELNVPVWNFYGPTESTVWTTCGLLERSASGAINSIGEPLAGLQAYVLDQQLQVVPSGVPAELFIGGAGLARGYLNRPELTAERFIPDPFSRQPGSRLYRTGDLVRRRRNGKLEFVGRRDSQVKLRGFRVELGEIEMALSRHAEVNQAAVVVREDRPNDQRLVAYVVANEGKTPTARELRRHLQLTLPEYMVPGTLIMLETMPLTRNNKVDRLRLPAPDYLAPEPGGSLDAPRTPIEELVANIWSGVLGPGQFGINDNFFALGGHSLLATQVISRLQDTFQIDLPLRSLFEHPTVAGLAEKIAELQRSRKGLQAPALSPLERTGEIPLSFAQQRLWFLDQLAPNNSFYNISRALRLCGPLDGSALAHALNEIIRRHESLRTSFVAKGGTPFQRIEDFAFPLVPLIDLSRVPDSEQAARAENLAAAEVSKPFTLAGEPLLRTLLLRLSDEEHVLILTLHHIAADGWSIGVLFRELSVLYENFVSGQPSSLPPLPIQYADYAVWQRAWLQGETLETLIAYWRHQLAGAPPVLALPTDYRRPQLQSFRGAELSFALPGGLSLNLRQLSRSRGATLFMTVLAAFQLLLSRFSGQRDLLIGTDVANRNRVETEGLIGFFTNLLPLRAHLAADLTFSELLSRVRETTLEAYAHQELPFEKLVEELKPARDLGRNPLVQVLLVMNQPPLKLELPHLQVSRFPLPVEESRFDLVLFLSDSDNGLAGFWLYNPDLFKQSTIGRLAVEYEKLLGAIVADPEARLAAYDIFSEDVKQKRMEKQLQQESQLERLRGRRRKAVDLARLSDVTSNELSPGQPLPLVIQPESMALNLAEWAVANQPFIDNQLLKHGALLFRGFAVNSVNEFENAAAAICPTLFGEYGDLPREELGGKVYGSTPYPADETILFHNESSHMHRWPMLIWFYCVQPAANGGESPLIDCRRIYQSLDRSLRQQFAERGLLYVRNFTDGLDVSWQSFFHTTDKLAVEDYCRRAGIEFTWLGTRGLRTRQFCPAVVTHPQTGERVFFNQLQLHHPYCLAPAVRESLLSLMSKEDLPRNVYYGDGAVIEDSVMAHLGELYRRLAVSFPWQTHDVLMLNNMLVAHSRNPYVGERRIVVALGDLFSKEEITSSHDR